MSETKSVTDRLNKFLDQFYAQGKIYDPCEGCKSDCSDCYHFRFFGKTGGEQ